MNPYLLLYLCASLFVACTCENVSNRSDETQETADANEEESLEIASGPDTNRSESCTRRQNSQVRAIAVAAHQQYPFMAALMSHDNNYLCAGTVVSNGMILTTAKCVKLSINYVLLNSVKTKKEDGSYKLNILRTEKFPTYVDGGEASIGIGLVYTEKHNTSVASKINLSNFTSRSKIIDATALGYGLNAEKGESKDLQCVGLEHRDIYSKTAPGEMMKFYIDCIETKIPSCFRDFGGPVIYHNEVIGVVETGQDECTKEMSADYHVNKFMADVIPAYTFKRWLDEKIAKSEHPKAVALATYPINAPEKGKESKKKSVRTGSGFMNTMSVQTNVAGLLLNVVIFLYAPYGLF